ncbi:NAD(P)/FAD-dependent oxidoreductase [Runella aurantiaca]|uniref:NAD(P)/FAD-dependent oxidoreductase n=1 Tax=Runella aurantiaca TaxID=2282308 RepID=A0A369I8I5_9BACT|nr:NAD(P)/FAD-dependent oxidoreductase [Runella aurantiaca]RDB04817.1 NAD(P)/FAD-dependent oxidoreductase [Runella aurantiaca]
MIETNHFDVIVIGGSYAGLSASMALGRSLRSVLIIDSGKPCNRTAPHSHNFITQDGETPAAIAQKAKDQVLVYPSIQFVADTVQSAQKEGNLFRIKTEANVEFTATKLLFATGIRDLMPDLPGFADCWGISILHCPYCHGYEVNGTALGILGNGEMGFEFAKLISQWTPHLTLFTNGPSTLSAEQTQKLLQHHIAIIEDEFDHLEQTDGKLEQVIFKNGSKQAVSAIFARVPFQQHCTIPQELGCELTENGYLKIDHFNQTTVAGVYAAGDNTSPMRAVSEATAAGTKAGASINKELIQDSF